MSVATLFSFQNIKNHSDSSCKQLSAAQLHYTSRTLKPVLELCTLIHPKHRHQGE